MDFLANNIRDVVVLGHQGSGKTSLVEAVYAVANNKKDKGSIEKKNTISDFTVEEKNRLTSCSLSVVNLAYQNYKMNLIDIPGNDDFIYEAIGVTKIVKGAILVIDASQGVQVETVKHYKLLKKRGIPTIIFVNKMDKEEVNFDDVLSDIQTKIAKTCVPFCLPIGHEHNFDGFINVVDLKARKYNGVECVDDVIHDDKKEKVLELHNMITEQVALTDDALLDKFRERAKENIKRYNDEQWQLVDVKKFSPKSYNYKAFEEGNKLFSNLSRCIVQACNNVQARGGSGIWLNSLDEKLGCENNDIERNIKSVIDEIGIENWAGYGPALTQDFFKDMGFSSFGKADTHLINVLNALFIPLDPEHEEKSVQEFLNEMASKIGTNVTASHIDKIIWLLRSGRFYKHSSLGYKLDEKGNKNTKLLCKRIYKQMQS